MQRRNFIHSISSLSAFGSLPINTLAQIVKLDHHGELRANKHDSLEATNFLSNIISQTSTVKCKGKDIKIHAIQTGTVAVKRSHLTNRTAHFLTPLKITFDRHFTDFMPIWVWVIEHPEGVIVIDTGENAEVMNPNYFDPAGVLVAKYNKRNIKFNINKENEIGFQLSLLGIKNEDIKTVVLTHLHLDHTDGLKDFRNVEIILNKDEYKSPSGHFPEFLPNWFNPKTVSYKNDFIDVFHQAYPITNAEDVLLIPTSGHTKHHASVLFKTDNFDILFAGDVCYNEKQLIEGDIPGINSHYKNSRETYSRIKTYAKKKNLIFLPSHDENSADRLTKNKFLK